MQVCWIIEWIGYVSIVPIDPATIHQVIRRPTVFGVCYGSRFYTYPSMTVDYGIQLDSIPIENSAHPLHELFFQWFERKIKP